MHEQIREWSDTVALIRACTTHEQISIIYEDIVGYDCAQDDPDASFEELQALALDYMREVCYAYGVHVSSIGLTS